MLDSLNYRARSSALSTYDQMMKDPTCRKLFVIESFLFQATEAIWDQMKEQNISLCDLASRLKTSESWLNDVLSGSVVLSVKMLAEILHALNCKVTLNVELTRPSC